MDLGEGKRKRETSVQEKKRIPSQTSDLHQDLWPNSFIFQLLGKLTE